MPEGLTNETLNQLELRRSRVRERLSYGAGALVFIVTLWGLMWMGDRAIAQMGMTAALMAVSYWFGERKASKNGDNKPQ